MGGSLSTLRTQVGKKLQDSSFTHYGGDNTEVNWAINTAIKYVSRLVPFDLLGTLQGVDTGAIQSGVTQYDLPSDFFLFKSAKWNGYWCKKVSIENLPLIDTNDFYTPNVNEPICYINENKITYLPVVSSGVADGRILYYVKVAATLTSDTDTSPLNDLLDHAVILYATALLASKDNDEKRWYEAFMMEIAKWGQK